jgi:hypothetical protein
LAKWLTINHPKVRPFSIATPRNSTDILEKMGVYAFLAVHLISQIWMIITIEKDTYGR